jgi:hypothetical protein
MFYNALRSIYTILALMLPLPLIGKSADFESVNLGSSPRGASRLNAVVAQWQSIPLVRERSGVQSSPTAPFLICASTPPDFESGES